MKMKLKSRKFWICVAAFLGSIGTSIAALHTGNEIVSAIGIVCAIVSAAIYAFCEAWVDSKAVNSKGRSEEERLDEMLAKAGMYHNSLVGEDYTSNVDVDDD